MSAFLTIHSIPGSVKLMSQALFYKESISIISKVKLAPKLNFSTNLLS